MSIKKKLETELVNHGLWPKEAESVVSAVIADEANKAMQGRWDEAPENYPPAIFALAWMSAKQHALAYIDREAPMHFARALLA